MASKKDKGGSGHAIPKLRVQRMGKLWRIVYDETRSLAKFGGGKPIDEGGFADEYKGGKKTIDGREAAYKVLQKTIASQPAAGNADPEAEGIGN